MRMLRPSPRFTSLLLLAALAGSLGAQAPAPAPISGPPGVGRRELVGVVKDARGNGLEGATIEVLGQTARTDASGLFRLFTSQIDTATIAIRRPGFSPIEAMISARNRQWDTVMVELETLTRLPDVAVKGERIRRQGLQGFEERVKQGVSGMFITRAEILERNSLRLSDVLQARKGINLVRLGPGRMGVRFATYGTVRRNCTPDMWVDGQRAQAMEIDDLTANTVEAMELYDSFSTVPTEFSHSANTVPCGTIVIWTRPPGTRKP
jgi:hypothetical protein